MVRRLRLGTSRPRRLRLTTRRSRLKPHSREANMSDDRGSGSSVILSFLLGGLAGAALAILYAPRSGKETREMLEGRMREGAERSRVLKDKMASRSRELMDDAAGYVDRQR